MPFRFGHVALIGKPNVGKSTLLNHIVGQKVSIVSNKPQTTRKSVLGIANADDYQIAFIDTPGVHDPRTTLGRSMVEHARKTLEDVDLIVYVADGAHHPGEEDKQIASMFKGATTQIPVIVCMNKMDLLKAENVERNVSAYCELMGTDVFMMTTATSGINVNKLVAMIVERLPERAPLYPTDEFTNQTSRFMAAELVREKILQATRQEVPHATAVVVDDWEDTETMSSISASIIVEKASQRGILIGKQGQFLKAVGTKARIEIEALLGKKVYLDLHVKVSENWRMNPRVLHELEYEE